MSRFTVLLTSIDRATITCDRIRMEDGVIIGTDEVIEVNSGEIRINYEVVAYIPDAIGFYKEEK